MFDLDDLDELEKKQDVSGNDSTQSTNEDAKKVSIDMEAVKDASAVGGIARADSAVFSTPKSSPLSGTLVENDYLARHGISEMLDEAILVLTYEQPEDPHAFLIDCIKKHQAERKKAEAASNPSQPGESSIYAMSQRLAAWFRSTPPESEELREAWKKLHALEDEILRTDLGPEDVLRIEEDYRATFKLIEEEKEKSAEQAQEGATSTNIGEADADGQETRPSFIASSASVLSDIVVATSLPKISARSFSGLFYSSETTSAEGATEETAKAATEEIANAPQNANGDSVENPQEAQESSYFDYAAKKIETVKESTATLSTTAKEYSTYYYSRTSTYLTSLWGADILKSLTEGQKVVVKEDFKTNSKTPLEVKIGQAGVVRTIDADGDAEIDFEGHSSLQWVFRRNFHKLSVEATEGASEDKPEANTEANTEEPVSEEKREKQRGEIAWQQVFGIKM